jgi:hypothetical protein
MLLIRKRDTFVISKIEPWIPSYLPEISVRVREVAALAAPHGGLDCLEYTHSGACSACAMAASTSALLFVL